MIYARNVREFVVGAEANCPMKRVSGMQSIGELKAIDVAFFDSSCFT
jgi:hypothetical protein